MDSPCHICMYIYKIITKGEEIHEFERQLRGHGGIWKKREGENDINMDEILNNKKKFN